MDELGVENWSGPRGLGRGAGRALIDPALTHWSDSEFCFAAGPSACVGRIPDPGLP